MKKRYLNYTWEQLIDEDSFINWILHKKKDAEWRKFILQHPEFRIKANKAREIISLFQDKYELVEDDIIKNMWKDIEHYEQHNRPEARILNLYHKMGWAAAVLLIIIMGTFIFINPSHEIHQFASGLDRNEAYVLLSNGEFIALNNGGSKIVIEGSSDELLVNDSVIYHKNQTGATQGGIIISEIVAPFGKRIELLLDDGSVIWLNAGSKLAFTSYHAKRREVYLEGEAFFDVIYNQNRIFIVRAGEMDVRVLGTSFNVSAYPNQETYETAVIRGKVSVDKRNILSKETVVLNPRQKAIYNKAENEVTVSDDPDMNNDIAWVQGWLVYQRENLGSVLHKIERYYNVTMHIPPGFSAEDQLTGKLDLNESFENVMNILSAAAGFDYSIKGKNVFLGNLH